MIERLLHQLEVAGGAQQLGAEVVPEVVEAETGHASTLAQIAPMALYAIESETG